jgi:aspartate 1-decarboxylase
VRTFVAAKIHDLRVTDKSVDYHGSISVAADLLDAAGIAPYEQVHVINLTNGARWVTYAIPAPAGAFTLNGGGARLGEKGDRCVVLTYRQSAAFEGAAVVYCDGANGIRETFLYATPTGHDRARP